MSVLGDVERVSLDELARYEAPEGTKTWTPIAHSRVMEVILQSLDMLRLEVSGMDLAVSNEGDRFFGTLDLKLDICDGVTLTAGIRNSVDQSFSLGFCCGERVMVCSNLCFGGEINVTKKHTAKVEDTFQGEVIKAATQIRQYGETSRGRIAELKDATLTDDQADALLLRAYEQGVVGARMLKPLIAEWRQPSYPDFEDRNRWSMLNAMTHVMKPRFQTTPLVAASESLAFNQFLVV